VTSRNPDRPNVLFVVADDLGAWALGCYGNKEAITPNIDELAASGVRLEEFFCTSPVCSPARASLLTGQIPSQHGVHDWISAGHLGPGAVDYLSGRTTLCDLACGAGYRCGLSGKWHLGASDHPRAGFVHWYAHESGGGPYFGAPMIRDGSRTRVRGYLTDALADDAVGFIRSETDRGPDPWWLHLHFTAPHSPWVGAHPAELVSLFEGCRFESCPQGVAHPWLLYHNGEVAAAVADPTESLKGYFAAVTGMDRALGRVLGVLDELKLTGSTLVVFVSDNGFNAGHHGVWGKGNGTYPQNMYDSSVRVPAIMSQRGRLLEGTSSSLLLSGYDLLPTLCDLLGLDSDPLPALPGRSFANVLGGKAMTVEPVVVFDEYGPVRMIRTSSWKYVSRSEEWPDELYDLVCDPGETTNLAAVPEHEQKKKELETELSQWFERWAEPGHDGALLPVTGLGQTAPLDEETREHFNQIPR